MIRGDLPPVLKQTKRRARQRLPSEPPPPTEPHYLEIRDNVTAATRASPPPPPTDEPHYLEIPRPETIGHTSPPPYVVTSDSHTIIPESPPLTPTINIQQPQPQQIPAQSTSPTPPSPTPPAMTTISITVTGPPQPYRLVVSLDPIPQPTTTPPPAATTTTPVVVEPQPPSACSCNTPAENNYISVEPAYMDLGGYPDSNGGSAPASPTLPAFPDPTERAISAASHTSSLSSSSQTSSHPSSASSASYYLRPIDREPYDDSNDGKLITPSSSARQTSPSLSINGSDSKRCSTVKVQPSQLQLLHPPQTEAPPEPQAPATLERFTDGMVKKTLFGRIASSIIGSSSSSRGDYIDATEVGRDEVDGKEAYLYDYVRTFPIRPRLKSPEPADESYVCRDALAPIVDTCDNLVYFTESENGYFPMGPPQRTITTETYDEASPAKIPPELPPRQYLRYRASTASASSSASSPAQTSASYLSESSTGQSPERPHHQLQQQHRSASAPSGMASGYILGSSSRTRKLLAWVRRRTRSAHK
jgi:hypothetical protein